MPITNLDTLHARAITARKRSAAKQDDHDDARSCEVMSRRASSIYRAGADLRALMRQRIDVRHSRNPIAIPESMLSRARPIHTRVSEGKFQIAKTVMQDDEGPQVSVTQFGTTLKAEREKTTVREALQGLIGVLDPDGRIEDQTDDDGLTHSVFVAKVLPDPTPWCELPQLDLSDLETLDIDEIERRVMAVSAEQEHYARARPPIFLGHVAFETFYGEDDQYGEPLEAWEFTRMTARRVLEIYRDHQGRPKAKQLLEQLASNQNLSPDMQVTVVTRADRTHMQVAILTIPLDTGTTERPDAVQVGQDEMLWSGEHHMGCVPYAVGKGRWTVADDPTMKFQGFLDPVLDLQQALDEATTQMVSNVRTSAWLSYYLKRTQQPPAASGAGESAKPIQVVENGIWDGALPGETVERFPGMDPSEAANVRSVIEFLRNQINVLTIPDTAGGSTSADSGYLFAQIQAAAEGVLDPWIRGKQAFWKRICELMLKAAHVAITVYEMGPIPVRYLSEEGAKDITLTEELTERAWDISVRARTRPVGGELAAVQTMKAMEDAGYIDHLSAMERLGVKNPLRTIRQQREYLILNSPEAIPLLWQIIQQRWLAKLQSEAMGAMPQTGAVPSALASVIQTPSLQERLGGAAFPGSQTAAGLPNIASQTMAPATPTMGQGAMNNFMTNALTNGGGGVGGQVMGQSRPSGTNSYQNMSDILGRAG